MRAPLKLVGRFSPKYDHVLERYLKNLRNLSRDYKREERGYDISVLTIDFSELFLYMFHSRTTRPDLRLVNYLFNRSLERDFKYTMLPPTIVELRTHYERLRRTAKKYTFSKKPGNSRELRQIYRKFSHLWPRDEKVVLESKECQEILLLWKEHCNKFQSYEFVQYMATEYGSRFLLDESHKRLVDLVNSRLIVRPQKVDFLSDRIQEVSSDEKTFQDVLLDLTERRSRVSDFARNLPDAEHAGIDFQINQEIVEEEEIMNIFTGSPAPLEVYENRLKMSPRTPPLVRCPIYMMIRTFCMNQLKSSYFDAMEFLDAGIEVVKDLMNWSPRKDIIAMAEKELNEMKECDKVEWLHHKILNYQVIFDIFRMNEGFGDYFSDALKSHLFNAIFKEKLQDTLTRSQKEYLRSMEIIETSVHAIELQEVYEDRLAESEEKIYNNLRDLYRFYIKMLEGFDFTKLSSLMREHYEFILSEPMSEVPSEKLGPLPFSAP